MKKGFYKLVSIICFSLVFIFLYGDIALPESITFTTYYPSPFGVYRELRSQRMAIGETYYNPANHCWPDGPCPSPDISDDTALIVEGNVGIGTTSPIGTLHIVGGDVIGGIKPTLRLEALSNSSGGTVQFIKGDGLAWGMGIGALALNKVFFINEDTYDSGTRDVSFVNTRFAIKQGGNVGIGTTIANNILTIKQTSATDPIADAWTTYSSRRWKKNIQPIKGALDKVLKLRGVCFDWKADGKHDIGMLAEEVGDVIPEVVAYEDNGIDAKSLDYARLTTVLVEAVKEQQKEIEGLKEEIQQLKGK